MAVRRKDRKVFPVKAPAEEQKMTACYTRLSQEDEGAGDSDSILNQRALMLKYCTDHQLENVRFFRGPGPTQIAKSLRASKVLTPTRYKLEKGLTTPDRPSADPYEWHSRTVAGILDRMEYTGCTVNFKTRKKSYKSKKVLHLSPEERKIFPNTHPAIVDRETWERVQELREHKHRPTKTGKRGLFSGLAYCADCMSKLYFRTYHGSTEDKDNYVCSNYKSNTGSCTIHFIREKVLTALVLAHLQATLAYVRENEAEQGVLEARAAELRRELAQGQEQAANVAQFLALVRKYTEVRELTPTIVNEFVKMVIVHAPTKVNGHRSQFVQVVYNLVGEVTIPETLDSKTA